MESPKFERAFQNILARDRKIRKNHSYFFPWLSILQFDILVGDLDVNFHMKCAKLAKLLKIGTCVRWDVRYLDPRRHTFVSHWVMPKKACKGQKRQNLALFSILPVFWSIFKLETRNFHCLVLCIIVSNSTFKKTY